MCWRRAAGSHLTCGPPGCSPIRRLTSSSARTVYVKHENHQPVGAFKVRGGVDLVAQLSSDARRRGLIAASTGNHGQSVAFAARRFGVAARIWSASSPSTGPGIRRVTEAPHAVAVDQGGQVGALSRGQQATQCGEQSLPTRVLPQEVG